MPTTPLGYFFTLVGLVVALLGLWVVSERYAPGAEYPGWPWPTVSPVFVGGAALLGVLVLNQTGGGVLGIAVRLAVARVRMLGLIVFGGLLVAAVYRNFILGS